MRPLIGFPLLAFLLIPCALAQPRLLDQVVAIVNDDPITQSELDTVLRPVYEDYKNEYHGQELIEKLNDAREKLLSQLIEDRLVLQEAQKRSIQIEESEIDRQMEEFKKRFPTETALEDALRKEDLSLNALRERLRKQLMVRRLHDMEIRSKIVISPLEVEDYYQSHPSEFTTTDRLKVRSITGKKNDESRERGLTDEEARRKILQIRKKIVRGDDFAELAMKYSEDAYAKQGGLGDWIQRGAMIPTIDAVIFRLKLGEISEVVESSMGYHVFRVEEKESGHKRTLEEARDDIFSKLFKKKIDTRFQDWMSELKKDAYISIR